MRLRPETKATRLHKLYRVLFWLLIVSPPLIIAFCFWTVSNLNRELGVESEWVRKEFGSDYSFSSDRINHQIGAYNDLATIAFAVLALTPLLPLLYRLLLYILHGRFAFGPRTQKPPRGSPPPPQQERKSQAGGTEGKPDPFTVLGVSRNATFEEIKSAYRTKMREYHPDKVASLGAELRELAERKAKQINEAYEMLSRQHATA